MNPSPHHQIKLIRLATALGALTLFGACSSGSGPSTDSQTHWLQPCQDNAACGDEGLSCLCGICVKPCTDNAACADTPTATACFADNTSTTDVICGGADKAKSVCLPECMEDKDCDAAESCVQAACVTTVALPKTIPCDGMSCDVGTQRCHTVSPGMVGPSTTTCEPIPAACTSTPTCDCVQANGEAITGCQELYPGALRTSTALP